MKIQIISDIHLEFYENGSYNFIKPTSSILCILGDLCCCDGAGFAKIRRFFDKITKLFKLIIWVPGNHEYYQDRCAGRNGTTINVDIQSARICSKYPNIKFLKNNRIEYLHQKVLYRFICTTLWTYIPPRLGKEVEKFMRDYLKIHVWNPKVKKPRKLTYKDVNLWHRKGVEYIKKEIENSKKLKQNLKRKIKYRNTKKGGIQKHSYNQIHQSNNFRKKREKMAPPMDYTSVKTIVLTHHKPFIDNKKISEVERISYESDQSNLLNSGHIDVWCYGHTHKYCHKKIGKCTVASNPRGYPREKTGYKIGFGITIS